MKMEADPVALETDEIGFLRCPFPFSFGKKSKPKVIN